MKHKSIEVKRMREEFLTVASHELKTPITALKLQMEMMLQLAESGALGRIPAEDLLKRLQMAERQVNRIHGLTESLLEAANIRSGALELKPELLQVAAVLQEARERFAEGSAARAQAITVAVEGEGHGFWDRGKINQVIRHLLGNAATFGLGKPIELKAVCRAGRAKIVVRDQGLGIPKDVQSKLFQIFHRGVPADRFGGFGLGLYIVNQVVQAHGGRVRVQSKSGLGTRFIVELPLIPERMRAPARAGGQRLAG